MTDVMEPVRTPEVCHASTYDVVTLLAHQCGLDAGHESPHECEACSEEWV